MTDFLRRKLIQAAGSAAALGPFAIGSVSAQQKGDIVIAASQPITGIFAFAGTAMNNGLNDFVLWKNANGGVAGRKLRYVSEDSGFKLDQGVAIFKKLMASEKPSFFYGDSTQWAKAVAQDAVAAGTIMTSSTSLASSMADPTGMPQHFVPGPIYGSMHEILMEYIAKTWSKSDKPKIAYVYADTEFGRDGIPAGKARAEKLGLPIVTEIVTKQAGIDVAPEVAKLRRARPDIVIFQGYILAPMPEFVRQMREAGLQSQVMGTAWGLDKPAYDALGAMGESLAGVSPYRYGHETDSTMINAMRDFGAKNRPDMKNISPFYISSWLSGMVFAEVADRCIKANKPLTLPNMKAALESMKEWDSGGIFGTLVDLSKHQAPVGRIYRYEPKTKTMEPASSWLKV
ncbi:ABC transporter substrate-binding protein [Variovorax sp. YR216]|uniref:ABC transporter substrate-binding protein n=1 Tax=Variovorax sp. YR216 TaxID=1882828 RepID=UPI0008987A8C|nr:ABC transporter substrate-binding protein [Variovorax sp. YR216]SEB21997.1 amino acid/amide ABC transporter substrate-binding protein, HAAT family [Variovorax sp. YR216]